VSWPPPRSSSERPPRAGASARHLVALLRPGQWPKSLVALLPLLDPGLAGWGALGRAALAALAFVVASAVIYVANDIADRDRDRAHPVKRNRPIASGRVSLVTAGAVAAGLVVALVGIVGASPALWWPLLTYLVINVAYCAGLKHLPLVDLFAVASGFVLRLVQGYVVLHARPSAWLVLCVLSACLLLILGKRRHELGVADAAHRPSLAGYNQHFVDHLLVLTAAVTLVAYQQHVTAFGTAALLTVPCALFALFRYLQAVLVRADGGNPVAVLLHDRVMVANGVLWLLLLQGGVLYG